MPPSQDLDLKLLDRALERHASERQSFARDLKIAALIGLVFLFGIFFRFVDLSDQQLALEARLKDMGEAQASLAAVKGGLNRIGEILQTEGPKVAEAVTQERDRLRSRILAINEDLDRMQETPSKVAAVPNLRANRPNQAPLPAAHHPVLDPTSPLHGLSPEQLAILREGGGSEYQPLIRTIINGRIVRRSLTS